MPDDPRITRLEEAVAFNERTIEELSAELRKAYARIDALARTIEDLGTRLTDLEVTGPDDDDDDDPTLHRPPHSAGPRD